MLVALSNTSSIGIGSPTSVSGSNIPVSTPVMPEESSLAKGSPLSASKTRIIKLVSLPKWIKLLTSS